MNDALTTTLFIDMDKANPKDTFVIADFERVDKITTSLAVIESIWDLGT